MTCIDLSLILLSLIHLSLIQLSLIHRNSPRIPSPPPPQDRLLRCSDESRALVCTGCGSLLTAAMLPPRGGAGGAQLPHRQPHCRACGHGDGVEVVSIPFVFKYLTNELAAMNIKTTLRV